MSDLLDVPHTGVFHPTMIHPHTGVPLEALGFWRDGRPIWPTMGASEDDDGGDAGGDDEGDEGEYGAGGDDEGDDDEDLDDGKSPEDLKAELSRIRKSYAKVLKEKRNLTKGGDGKPRPPKVKTGEGDDGKDSFTKDDVEATREETREAVRAEMLPAVIRPAARTVLEKLGMQFGKDEDVARAKLSRTLKLADIDDVELDEDGELVGLEQALREVRKAFPEMFRGTRARTPGNAGGGRRPSTKPKSATEMQAAAVFGGGDDD